MKNLLWIPIAVLLLGACAKVDLARDIVKLKGAKVADEILIDAEWAVCYLSSIGSIKRRYGQTVERATTYKDFCDGDGVANVVLPE